MPVIDRSVVIARPAAEVFDFVVHAENLPRWDSSIAECVQLDDAPVTVGTRYRGVSTVLGRRIDWTTEVTDLVQGARAQSQSIDGPLRFTVSYEITSMPRVTALRYRLAAESGLGGAFGRAMEPIIEKAQTKVVQANLDALARLLEQRAA